MTLRFAITGSSGIIGSHLTDYLFKKGHIVTPIVRSSTPIKYNRKVIRWDIEHQHIEPEALEGYDVVVHLAGAGIAGSRWTNKYKNIIKESRIRGTEFLSSTLARLKRRPQVFLSASAMGYYGNSFLNDRKDESSPRGFGFLAEVCDLWEKATAPAQAAGIRVVHMRFGMVLDQRGGALGKMLPIFKLGLGGKIGSGKQPISWISNQEIPFVILHVINSASMTGPVNFVAPQVVSNEEFTRTLGEALHRPTVFPLPAFAAKLMFGEMADSLLLGGVNVVTRRLEDSGYPFHFPNLKTALQHLLTK